MIHLANIRTKRNDAGWADCLDNMVGTRTIFETARQNGVRRIAYASETGVMGSLPMKVQRTVKLPTRARSGYPLGKVFDEKLGRMYSSRYGIGFVGVRVDRINPDGEAGSGSVDAVHPFDLTHSDVVRVFERSVVHPKASTRSSLASRTAPGNSLIWATVARSSVTIP